MRPRADRSSGDPAAADDGAGPLAARVIIEMHRLEDPIAGTLHAGSDSPQPFLGWTGLLAALQGALNSADRR